MKCRACGFENPPGFKFCGECATALTAAARDPSATPARADPRSYTPPHLAEKILTSRGALEGERKQVTVLFADVKGSMDLSEGLDPEEWHRIMDRFFTILAAGVHRFEGTVNQYTGDGVMALFGAPIAHEDHAQRACWAALHLRDELRRHAEEVKRTHGLNFSVRVGLNSGDVVVGTIGDDLRMEYTAQGHARAREAHRILCPGTVANAPKLRAFLARCAVVVRESGSLGRCLAGRTCRGQCVTRGPVGARSRASAASRSNAAVAGSRSTSTSAALSSGSASMRVARVRSRSTKAVRLAATVASVSA